MRCDLHTIAAAHSRKLEQYGGESVLRGITYETEQKKLKYCQHERRRAKRYALYKMYDEVKQWR